MLAAADAEATAFVNLRYDRAAGIEAVAAGATGDFRRTTCGPRVTWSATMQRQRSTLTGHVVSSGVVDVGPDRATVIVGDQRDRLEPAHRRGQEVPRHFRLRLTLRPRGRPLADLRHRVRRGRGMTGRTTGVLGRCALVLAAVVAGEAWYLWGVSEPTPSAARPVVIGDIERPQRGGDGGAGRRRDLHRRRGRTTTRTSTVRPR